MKAIIFGSNGQDGYYLKELLLKKSIEVLTVSRKNADKLGSVADYEFVNKVINEYKPNYVFHLAADSSTSHQALFANHEAISTGTLNILESMKNHCPRSKVFLSGSAVQFKNDDTPINEQTPFAPISPYAVSRIHSVMLGRYYRDILGLKVYVGYFFNHDSFLRTERHINQKIVSYIKNVALDPKNDEKLEIGDFSAKKEFNFAGDLMEAVFTLVSQDEVFEVVIGSGQAHSIAEWLEICFAKFKLNFKDFVIENKKYSSPYKILVSDPQKIKSLGWSAQHNINDLAEMMIEGN